MVRFKHSKSGKFVSVPRPDRSHYPRFFWLKWVLVAIVIIIVIFMIAMLK